MTVKHFIIIISFILGSCRIKSSDDSRIIKNSESQNGMVVSANPIASAVGKNILMKGGNAIDAAIAVQFALAVVFPEAGNIGGGGFMTLRLKDGDCFSLDFREMAPWHASENMYLNDAGEIKENASINGHLACGVPGSVDGMVNAYGKFGNLPWNLLIEPAIHLAENGFPITARQAQSFNINQKNFIRENPNSAEFLIKKNWQEGDLLVQKDLAESLRRIRDNKRSGFYEGITAENILNEMKRGNGLITMQDLQNYKSIWREPVTMEYRGYKVITIGPPSSGGILLKQLLKMVEPFRLDTLKREEINYIHLLCEAEKRAFADRAEFLGDQDFVHVPIQQLTDDAYVAERMRGFSFQKISPTIIHGTIAMSYESSETTHFSVVDRDHNAVSVTTTLNNSYGSKVIVGGSGFFLNDEMDDFSIKPGHLNIFGMTGGNANSIQPGKRMLSSMTPAIIEKNGQLYCILGSPGGSRIITTVFQMILNIVDLKMPLGAAVASPRFHHQGLPDTLYYERNFDSPNTTRMLMDRGYHLASVESIGRVDAIMISNNSFIGSADPRGDDSVSGW